MGFALYLRFAHLGANLRGKSASNERESYKGESIKSANLMGESIKTTNRRIILCAKCYFDSPLGFLSILSKRDSISISFLSMPTLTVT